MLIFSSLIVSIYMIVSLLFETWMQSSSGFSIYADFSPLLTTEIWSVTHIINLLLQGVLFSAVFILTTSQRISWVSGLRFGMIIGSLCLVVCLTGLMPKIGGTPVRFITDSLTDLCIVQFLRFAVIGLISGWLYQQYLQRAPSLRQLWI